MHFSGCYIPLSNVVRVCIGIDGLHNTTSVKSVIIMSRDDSTLSNHSLPVYQIQHYWVEFMEAVDIDEVQAAIRNVFDGIQAFFLNVYGIIIL